MSQLVSSSDRGVWLAGGVPKKKRKNKSGVSRAGADLALLQKLMVNAGRDMFDEPTPEVRAVPERVQGFRVRVDLLYARPPIWRRLDLPGDLGNRHARRRLARRHSNLRGHTREVRIAGFQIHHDIMRRRAR